MNTRYLLTTIALLGAMVVGGCGVDDGASTPVVKVSESDQKAFESHKAEQTVAWLEGLPPAERQSAVERAPAVKGILKNAQTTVLKSRIEALGIHL